VKINSFVLQKTATLDQYKEEEKNTKKVQLQIMLMVVASL